MLGRKNLPLNAHPISVSMFISQVERHNQGSYVCSGKYNNTKKFSFRRLTRLLPMTLYQITHLTAEAVNIVKSDRLACG